MLIQLTYIMCVVYNCMSCLMLKGEQNEASGCYDRINSFSKGKLLCTPGVP